MKEEEEEEKSIKHQWANLKPVKYLSVGNT